MENKIKLPSEETNKIKIKVTKFKKRTESTLNVLGVLIAIVVAGGVITNKVTEITVKDYISEHEYKLENATFTKDGVIIEDTNRKYTTINDISIDKYYSNLGYTLIDDENQEVYYNEYDIKTKNYVEFEVNDINGDTKLASIFVKFFKVTINFLTLYILYLLSVSENVATKATKVYAKIVINRAEKRCSVKL